MNQKTWPLKIVSVRSGDPLLKSCDPLQDQVIHYQEYVKCATCGKSVIPSDELVHSVIDFFIQRWM